MLSSDLVIEGCVYLSLLPIRILCTTVIDSLISLSLSLSLSLSFSLFPSLSLSGVQVYIWDTTDFSKEKTTLKFTNTILDIDIHGDNQLVVGSTTVQFMYLDNLEKRRTIADDMGSDESLEDPALHRAKFGPKGHIITASVEASVLKLWPVMSNTSKIVSEPDTRILMGQELDQPGCIYR